MASVIANTVISLIGRAGGVAIGLIVTALLGRVLGVEEFGSYSLLLSFGAILHVITDGGLYLTLARDISDRAVDVRKTVSVVAGLRLLVFGIVFFIGFGLLYVLPGYRSYVGLYGLAALGFLFQSLSQLLMAVFQNRGTMWQAAVGDIVGRVVQLGIVVALVVGIIGGWSAVVVAVLAFTGSAAVAYGLHASFAVSHGFPLGIQGSYAAWQDILRRSWPLGLMLILNAIYFRTDMLMLSWFRSEYEVGLYGFAYRIIESALFLPAAFGGLLLPRLVATTKQSTRAVMLGQALTVMLLVGGVVYGLLPPLAEQVTVLLVGSEFAEAGSILVILVTALVIMFLGNVFGFTLVALDKQKLLLKLYAWLAVGNVAANLVFIPQFGAVAAAWTTVVTEAVATIVAGAVVSRYIPYVISWRVIGLVVAATAIVTNLMTGMSTRYHVLVSLMVGLLVFGGLYYVTGLFRRKYVSLLVQSPSDL